MNSDTPRTDAVVRSHCEDGPFVTNHHIALSEFARTLERENQQLREGLRVCVEALNELLTNDSIADKKGQQIYQYSFQTGSQMHFDIKKALAHPAVQAALRNNSQ